MVDKLVNSEINAKRIANVEYCFGMSGVPLGVCGRVLVGEGILTKICRKKPKSRQFFLFNDILVYGTILINKKKYAQQHIIPLEGLVVEDLPDEPVMKNGWLIKTSSKSFAVYAGSPSEKAEWIRHIKKCANDLLEQTGRTAPLEHAAVWIPDSIARICMHCKRTQFTMINRRHHCRKCGSVICGHCSKNRVVILHQSNSPVRVCDACYRKFYSHLNRAKKLSTGVITSIEDRSSTENANLASLEPANLSIKSIEEEKQQLIDENEIKQVVRECMHDAVNKENRVEEWIDLASEQITEHLELTKNQNISETATNNDVNLDPISEAEIENRDEQSTECKNDSFNNNQTSDSEDEHNDLSSSVEDILEDEVHRKPTFYDLQISEEMIKDELKDKNVLDEVDLTNGQIESNVKVENHDVANVDAQTVPLLIITDIEVNQNIDDENDGKDVKNESKSDLKNINEFKDQIKTSL